MAQHFVGPVLATERRGVALAPDETVILLHPVYL